ncbi:MAG TPA: rhodanese-like domain-containing protein [Burkholderiaceae bacterium]|nr:rhodanese-like domain-containing protein [Burkholderiaceae bacterium]
MIKPLVASLLLAIAASSVALDAAAAPQTVDVQQAAALQSGGALLIDVRETGEYAEGHAPGSVLIPLGQLQQRLPEIESYKDKPVVLICRSGNRSAKALKQLQQAGFSAASNIDGGMIAWKKAGLPIVSAGAGR